MDKFTSSDCLKGPTFCIGAVRDDAFDADGGQFKKQRLTEEINFLTDAQFFKAVFENEDQDDADQEIHKKRSVQRILPHILSAQQEDHEGIDLLGQFPIDDVDINGWNQDNTQLDQGMDHANLAANPCGLRHQQPNDADPLETQRKRASPSMMLHPCDELKNSSSSNNQYQNDCSSSHGESLDDDGNDSTDRSSHSDNEPLPQDAAQDQQLQIHPSHQEEELDSQDNDHLPPAANHALVDRDDAVSASSSTASRTATPRRKRDILFGRGGRSNYHPGNQYLLQLIPEYFELYSIQTTRAGQKRVIDGILARLRSENRRFLSLLDDDDHWFQVLDYKTRYKKVSHAMRGFRNNNKE